jgi:hypothetical protein
MVNFPTAYYVNISLYNVGKTKQLKENVKENTWCHQKMNRKKYVYFDNDPYLASFAVNIDSKHI